MAYKGGQPGQGHAALLQTIGATQPVSQHHGQPSLGRIKQQGQRGGGPVARAQNIGGARVLAPIGSGVAQAHDAADDHGKRQRAQQIPQQNRQHRIKHW